MGDDAGFADPTCLQYAGRRTSTCSVSCISLGKGVHSAFPVPVRVCRGAEGSIHAPTAPRHAASSFRCPTGCRAPHGQPFARIADPVHKVRPVGRTEEDRRPAVAAIHDLIADSAHRCPCRSWHDPYPTVSPLSAWRAFSLPAAFWCGPVLRPARPGRAGRACIRRRAPCWADLRERTWPRRSLFRRRG